MFYFLNKYIFHWVPEKAIWIGGHTLSWDARCSGIYIGFGIGALYHLLISKKKAGFPSFAVAVLKAVFLLPLFVDVFTITSGFRIPSNEIRYITGLLFGEAFSWIVFPAFAILAHATTAHDAERNSSGDMRGAISILIVIVMAFILKFWDSVISYIILEALSVFGFLSLFTILVWSGVNLLKRDF